MPDDVESTIAQYADDAAVVAELHAVPPYRVYGVRLDGRQAVLKVDAHPRGHAADEGRVHAYVADRTDAPAPAVLAVGADHYLAEWDDRVARARGELTVGWARAAGAWLGRLHADTAGDFEGYGRPGDGGDGSLRVDARAEWVDAARARLAYHREYLETIGYADVADAVDDLLADHPEVFDGAGAPVLCHSNVHPEHVAVRGGRAVAAVDFEHVLVAPGEYDYWRAAMPLFEAADDVDDAVRRAFREGYERHRSLPAGLERRREAYALVNFVAYVESLYLQGNVDPPRRERTGEGFRTRVLEGVTRLLAELD